MATTEGQFASVNEVERLKFKGRNNSADRVIIIEHASERPIRNIEEARLLVVAIIKKGCVVSDRIAIIAANSRPIAISIAIDTLRRSSFKEELKLPVITRSHVEACCRITVHDLPII